MILRHFTTPHLVRLLLVRPPREPYTITKDEALRMEHAATVGHMVRQDRDAVYRRNLPRYRSDALRLRARRAIEDIDGPTIFVQEGNSLVAVPLIHD